MDTLGHNIAVSGANGSVGNAAWHNVAGVFTRASIGQIYVDGNLVSQQAIFAVGDWGNLATMKWTIGQDPSGVYGGDTASATTGEISDVGMWRRALSPVELAGIYLAGSQNTPAVTFAPVVVPAASVTISNIVNNLNGTVTINYGGGAGSQFILVKSAIVPTATGNRDNWTPVLTNTASPGSFTTPLSGTEFYSIESK
jgi:hypothetical protein